MKFKIAYGTALYQIFADWFKRKNKADEIARDLALEFGAETFAMVRDHVAGFLFPSTTPIEGWRVSDRRQNMRIHIPRSSKTNKGLLERIASIPFPKRQELADAVGFKTQVVGMAFISGIGCKLTPAFVLVEIRENAQYDPLPEMIEITVSEYKALSESKEPVTP